MNQIKRDLKEIKYYYENKELLDLYFNQFSGIEDTVQDKAYRISRCVALAPVHIQEIYLELYVNHKTVCALANEKYCSEQYLVKRKTELFKYLYKHKEKIYSKKQAF